MLFHFMQIVKACFFWKNKKNVVKMSSAESFTQHARHLKVSSEVLRVWWNLVWGNQADKCT